MRVTAQPKASLWKTVPLGGIAEVRLGKMLDKTKHRKGRRLPYLRNINVRWGTVETDDLLDMYFEDDELDRFGLHAGDVLVCEGGEPGRAAVWDGRLPDLKYQKAIHRVRFSVPFEPRLLVYQLERVAKAGGLERRFTGSTIKHLTREKFVEWPVAVPPIDEQHLIVAEIDKQFTRLAAGMAALRRAQANLKRYRAAVLKAACEGRLVPTEAGLARKECRLYETGELLLIRILIDRRQKAGRVKHVEPPPPETANLPLLSEGWAYASVAQLGVVGEQTVLTGPFGTSLGRGDFRERGVPVLTISCLTDTGIQTRKANFVSREKARALDRYQLNAGDLLFSRMASVGRAGIVSEALRGALFNYHIMRLRLNPAVLLPKFYLAYVRGSTQVERYIRGVNHGATRNGINTEQLLNMPVALPPLAEQERIVAEVERRLSVIDELQAVVTADLQRATRLRQSILERAFSGRLVNALD
jgi:type I restriction enzyme S subunit